MKKRIYLLSTLLPVLGFLFAAPTLSAEADLVKAEKVYKRSCATCHGKQGEKPAMGESKIINQLKPEEISTHFQNEKREKLLINKNQKKFQPHFQNEKREIFLVQEARQNNV